MQFTLVGFIASVAALVAAVPQPRQNCPEATRFGVVTLSPASVAPGEILTINADFNCAVNSFGIRPEFTDYYIEVPVNNNGHEPPILLSRHTPSGTSDSFTVTVPVAYYFANTSYAVKLDTTYPVNGPNGMPYSVVGSVEVPITITV